MMLQNSRTARVYHFIKCISFTTLLLLIVSSCRTQKQPSSDDFILFGNGGGIAGKETIYKLHGNGSLFSKTSIEADFTLIKQDIATREVKSIFKAVNTINWSGIKLNNPGNIYRFMIYEKDGETYKLTWGGGTTDVPEEVVSLYNRLSTLTQ